MTVYGYVGLGALGAEMATRLVGSGADVRVFDVDPPAVDRLVDRGAIAAESLADLATSADVISVCVPAAEHVAAVLGGLAPGGRHGQAILVHSTVAPATIVDSAATAAAWGGVVFDACPAGGGAAAREGRLAVMVGGLVEMPVVARDLLDVYATKVVDAGPVGAGAALKIAVNVMTYAQFAAAATSHELIVGAGGDPAALLETWRHTGMLGELTAQYSLLLGVSPDDVTGDLADLVGTQLGIAQKDLTLAIELGQRAGAGRSRLVEAIHDLMPAVYRTAPMPGSRAPDDA